jgi:hypothetical protein
MNIKDLMNIIDENSHSNEPEIGDMVEIEMGDTLLETYIIDTTNDGVVVQIDESMLKLMIDAKKQLNERMVMGVSSDASAAGSKVMGEDDDLDEAKYQGREVTLGKPMAGDVKKSKVYVRGPKGNVVKVNFGDKKMRIKKSNPKRRKSFRARHRCENPGPRWKARYWSCKMW